MRSYAAVVTLSLIAAIPLALLGLGLIYDGLLGNMEDGDQTAVGGLMMIVAGGALVTWALER